MSAAAPRVLLINPRMCSRRSMRLPLSLLSLAAVLEGRYEYEILDGNRVDDLDGRIEAALRRSPQAVAAVSVMPGPQVAPAIAASCAIRAARPDVPILWGGYFPTLYSDAAINAPYVDYVVRGAGEDTLLELLPRLAEAPPGPPGAARTALVAGDIAGLTWKDVDGVVHNAARAFVPPDDRPPLPYHRLEGLREYLRPTFMGTRTAVHQAAIGCRYRCTFCGVVSVYNGLTRLSSPARLAAALAVLRDRHGADAVQFYDNNFFDSPSSAEEALDVLASARLPWWCYGRADTMARFSAATWENVRRSQLRMAYIGAEAASDAVLQAMKKGTRVEHTLEVAARCREAGVVPEFSFVLGGPTDPEAEIEHTLAFVRRLKALHPDCEVILYFYSPTPQRDRAWADRDVALLPTLTQYGPDGPALPTTPEEWTEPRWIRYVCHQDAPWLTPRIRRRVRDFAEVIGCRFPTVQDARTPAWGKRVLRALASWRYASGVYARPLELALARRVIPLKRPEVEGL
jgi:anaerobic magnesium-protoporphyrin IX monomethyl ester cyclase